jgi:hypothetical protein
LGFQPMSSSLKAVPGVVTFHAANPCLPELPIGLPNLVRELLDAWAFWLANPTFSTQTLEVDCGLKFSADVPCVYRKLRHGRNGDAVHRGEHMT